VASLEGANQVNVRVKRSGKRGSLTASNVLQHASSTRGVHGRDRGAFDEALRLVAAIASDERSRFSAGKLSFDFPGDPIRHVKIEIVQRKGSHTSVGVQVARRRGDFLNGRRVGFGACGGFTHPARSGTATVDQNAEIAATSPHNAGDRAHRADVNQAVDHGRVDDLGQRKAAVRVHRRRNRLGIIAVSNATAAGIVREGALGFQRGSTFGIIADRAGSLGFDFAHLGTDGVQRVIQLLDFVGHNRVGLAGQFSVNLGLEHVKDLALLFKQGLNFDAHVFVPYRERIDRLRRNSATTSAASCSGSP
jgi:hypothetical protein